MAECVVELCRQPALPMPVSVEVGSLRLEIPACATHAEEVRSEFDWLVQTAREASWVDG